MGTKMTPTYATLTLGFLEEKMYETTTKTLGDKIGNQLVYNWKRYLDDCFIIWDHDEGSLEIFHNILNELDPDIKFTMETSSTSIPFLDILVLKQGECINTDIYYKPTDTHQYLDFGSCHPRHIKRSIPYNLARRIYTIVSDECTREQRLQDLRIFLKQRNYPDNLIEDGIHKATGLNRTDLIHPGPILVLMKVKFYQLLLLTTRRIKI